MEVFISWSGEPSRVAAQALRDWLPKVINAVCPWLSSSDIDRGARWASDVASRLQSARFGIICLTPGNLHSDWILFEAGALSKSVESSRVCPLLFGIQPESVRGPLAQFQATRAEKEEMRRLVDTINQALGNQALSEGHLREAFDLWWPKLEEKFSRMPVEESVEQPANDDRAILAEVRDLVWSLVRSSATSGPGRARIGGIISGLMLSGSANSHRAAQRLQSELGQHLGAGVSVVSVDPARDKDGIGHFVVVLKAAGDRAARILVVPGSSGNTISIAQHILDQLQHSDDSDGKDRDMGAEPPPIVGVR